jgi:hypothetical protein
MVRFPDTGSPRHAEAEAAYADLFPLVAELRAEGLSLRRIADRLNAEGHRDVAAASPSNRPYPGGDALLPQMSYSSVGRGSWGTQRTT